MSARAWGPRTCTTVTPWAPSSPPPSPACPPTAAPSSSASSSRLVGPGRKPTISSPRPHRPVGPRPSPRRPPAPRSPGIRLPLPGSPMAKPSRNGGSISARAWGLRTCTTVTPWAPSSPPPSPACPPTAVPSLSVSSSRISGSWQEADYQFTAASPPSGTPALTTPTPGSTLAGDSCHLCLGRQWRIRHSNGGSISARASGAKDLHDSGSLGTQLSTTVSGLPTDGSTLFVRLFFRISGTWQEADYQFTAASSSGTLLTDNFADGNFAGWTVVDQGTTSAPPVGPPPPVNYGRPRISTAVVRADSQLLGTHLRYDQGFSWTDYHVSLTLRSDDNDSIGVMVRYQDPDNYYRFSWDQQRSNRRLVKVHNGVFTLLAEDSVPYVQGQTYQVDFLAEGAQLEVQIDGTSIFNVADTSLTAGTVGLYTWANNGARFDNVQVTQGVATASTAHPNPHDTDPRLHARRGFVPPLPGLPMVPRSQNGGSISARAWGPRTCTTVTPWVPSSPPPSPACPPTAVPSLSASSSGLVGTWQEADYQFTAASPPSGTPALTARRPPAPRSPGIRATFAWAANGESVTRMVALYRHEPRAPRTSTTVAPWAPSSPPPSPACPPTAVPSLSASSSVLVGRGRKPTISSPRPHRPVAPRPSRHRPLARTLAGDSCLLCLGCQWPSRHGMVALYRHEPRGQEPVRQWLFGYPALHHRLRPAH